VGLPSLDRADLFIDAYQSGTAEPIIQRRGISFPALTISSLIGPVALFGVLYLIYNFVLNSVVEDFFNRVV